MIVYLSWMFGKLTLIELLTMRIYFKSSKNPVRSSGTVFNNQFSMRKSYHIERYMIFANIDFWGIFLKNTNTTGLSVNYLN